MRLLIVPSWYPTTDNPINGIFFKEQAQALQRRGHEVIVVYPHLMSLKEVVKNKDKLGYTFKREDGLPTYRYNGFNLLPKIPGGEGLVYYWHLRRLYSRIEKEFGKPDVVHAHSALWGGYAAAKLFKGLGIPLIITEHFSGFLKQNLSDAKQERARFAFTSAKKIIAVGPSLAKELASYVPAKKIMLIPNIVNVDKFEVKSKKKCANVFRFFSLAFLNYNKGFDVLIQAFAKAFKGKKVELVIGGDGSEKDNLLKLTETLGLAEQVYFLGILDREQVKKEMQECDSFVLASRLETFGVVFIEALACGKPVVGTSCGGPEMIINTENGYLVPVNNISALAKAMDRMFHEYQRFVPEKIRQDCIERFSEKSIVKKLEDIYHKSLEL